MDGFEIGDKVVKKSGKPFKMSGGITRRHDFIGRFCPNDQSPRKASAAKLIISETVVNLSQLQKAD